MSQTVCKDRCQNLGTEAIADDETLKNWLVSQAIEHKLSYLLAHADDGVIWGYFSGAELAIARDVFLQFPKLPQFPELRLSTLKQCRVFGRDGEVFLWRTAQGWKARLINDPPTERQDIDAIVEDQVLWGTQSKAERDGFTLLADGQQELYHAVPLTTIEFENAKQLKRPVRLRVKHYIQYDNDGLARIGLSRLVDIFAEPREK